VWYRSPDASAHVLRHHINSRMFTHPPGVFRVFVYESGSFVSLACTRTTVERITHIILLCRTQNYRQLCRNRNLRECGLGREHICPVTFLNPPADPSSSLKLKIIIDILFEYRRLASGRVCG